MADASDMDLVREFAVHHSETAFTELVRRQINLVYSVALRFTGTAGDAQDVTQAVFIILARKAAGLRAGTVLTGWLYETTRFTAARLVRTRARRRAHEQEAAMQSTFDEPGHDDLWRHLAPHLEAAMSRLGERDRTLLALRFYENKTGAEAAALLGMREEAARKRTSRALEKLRRFFFQRGVHSTTAIIGETISTHSIQTAPAALAKTITAVALAKGAAASASTLTLIEGAMKIMAWTKVKTAVVIGASVILAMSVATVVVKASFFPIIKDVYFQPNYRQFQNLPTGLFVLRPTHFQTPANGVDYSGEGSSPSGEHVTRMMGRNRSFEQLIARLYNCGQFQIDFRDGAPKEHFDYLSTILDTNTWERFETSIKKKLGYVASWQQRDTEVFQLEVKTPNSPELKKANPSNNSETWRDSQNRLEFRNRSLRSLADQIETVANIPVMDKTGRTDALDFDLNCARMDLENRNWDSVNRALDPLGLELVPTNMPMNMLVVAKVR